MSPDNDDLLCQRYPQLFVERHFSIDQTAMCRGFECGDGWFRLIDTLCATIQNAIELDDMPPVTVTQVKEKLGSLRFHYRGGNEMTVGMVRLASDLSTKIDPDTGRWVTTVGDSGATE